MPLANRAALEAASTRFIGIFDSALRATDTVHENYSMHVPSDGKTNTYDYMPLGLDVREWKGARIHHGSKIYSYSISNKPWEATLDIDYYDIDDDALGLYDDQVRQMAVMVRTHPQRLFAEMLNAGFTQQGVLGVTFFSAAIPSAPGVAVRSNRVASDAPLSATTFRTARTMLRSQRAYNGNRLHLLKMGEPVLIVPPTLEETARTILELELSTAGISNQDFGRAKLEVIEELEDHSTTAWYLGLRGPMVPKPMIFQERMAARLHVKDNPAQSDQVFETRKISYGTEARYNFGYLHPETIIGSDGTND